MRRSGLIRAKDVTRRCSHSFETDSSNSACIASFGEEVDGGSWARRLFREVTWCGEGIRGGDPQGVREIWKVCGRYLTRGDCGKSVGRRLRSRRSEGFWRAASRRAPEGCIAAWAVMML